MRRAVARGLKARTQVDVRHLAVDEVCSKKGHEYVTIVSNEAGSVIDVTQNRSKASLLEFYHRLAPKDLQSIETGSMDMSQAYQAATKEALADWHTKICFDRFHIAMNLNKAVNDVRKVELCSLPSRYR